MGSTTVNWEDLEPNLQTGLLPEPGPFNDHINVEVLRWGPKAAEARIVMQDYHQNSLQVAHGGVAMTLMDFCMGIAGSFQQDRVNRRSCMTISMTTNFHAPVTAPEIIGRGWVTGGGRKVFFASAAVLDLDQNLLLEATGVFKYLSR